jgi:hypothetical protein
MKKLIFLFVAIFCGAMITQAQTLSDPNAVPIITPKQIEALGQQHQYPESIIVLDFEGLGDVDAINGFYNGGTSAAGFSGTNYGVEFGYDALGIIDLDAGGSGHFANEPSPSTIMFWMDVANTYMNVPAGFTTGFSFYYSAYYTGLVSIYDGLNGTGNLLASINLPINYNSGGCTGDPDGLYCNWDPVGVPFTGTAMSVVFSGNADFIGFDDVTFGSVNPDPPVGVPVSNWAIILGIFLIAVFMVFRFRRRMA